MAVKTFIVQAPGDRNKQLIFKVTKLGSGSIKVTVTVMANW